MPMSSFRRSTAADTRRKGGGRRGGIYDRMKLPKDNATPIMIIKGDYVDPNPAVDFLEVDPATGRPKEVKIPYYKFRKHRRAIKQGQKEFFPDETCSAGMDPHNPQPCVGCYHQDQGDKSVTLSDNFALGVVHLAFYHGHPLIDAETGGFIANRNDPNKKVIVYDECSGRTCNYCRVLQGQQPVLKQGETFPSYQASDLTTVFGRRRFLEVGKSHLSNLQGWDQAVSTLCGTCYQNMAQVKLIIDSYTCPYCSNVVIDMANDPRTDEEISDAVSRPYPCLHCRRSVVLVENLSCDACGKGTQMTIHDVVMFGKRVGEGTKSQMQMDYFQTVAQFERTMGQSLAPYLNGKTLAEYIAELAQPYDFAEVLRPRSLQDQATRLQLPMIPAHGQQQQFQQSAYGAPPTQNYPPAPGYAPPPQGVPAQPPYAAYPQQQTQQPQNGPGPAPFVPGGRPNFGS